MVDIVFINRMRGWLRERFMRRTISRDISEELRFHLAQRTAEYERAGMGSEEARRLARQRFGNMDRVIDSCHEVQRVPYPKESRMETIWRDIRIGVRTLRRTPGFAAVAILTLALGIGANTAVFTVLNSVLLAPLPYDQPERLVRMYTAYDGFPEARSVLSGPDFVDYRNQVDVFDQLAVLYTYRERGLDIAGSDGVAQRIRALPVSSGYFEVFRAPPMLGRTFTRDEEREETRLVVLSHRLWMDQTNGDRDILGRGIMMDGDAYTVIGIMPPHFLDVVAGEIPANVQDVQKNGLLAPIDGDFSVNFGGMTLAGSRDILYAGLASCCAGLYQIVLKVPEELADGNHQITATVDGVSTPSGPFITVKSSP